MKYAKVAAILPLREPLTYSIPERFEGFADAGVRCAVPLGPRKVAGFILSVMPEPDIEATRIKPIQEILDEIPPLTPDLLRLGEWAANYYQYPIGEVLDAFLPPSARTPSKVIYAATGVDAGPFSKGATALLTRISGHKKGLSSALLKGRESAPLEELLSAGAVRREWSVPKPRGLKGQRWLLLTEKAPAPETLPASATRLAQLLELLSYGPQEAAGLKGAGITGDTVKRGERHGWVALSETPPEAREAGGFGYGGAGKISLTDSQKRAVERVGEAVRASRFEPFLLFGVTGSGKTEVYLSAVKGALEAGKNALILVPEISLTPQLLGRFASALGDGMAVLHSGLSERERRLQWERVRDGGARVVIGTRSAVWAPLKDIGLMVVDEEHDPSYKQADGLRYNAKHAALMRGREVGAPVLLGSATPEVDSFLSAREGRFTLLSLPERVMGASFPEIKLIDLRDEEREKRQRITISEELGGAVDDALSRGEQALLFINRRGLNSALFCPECESSVKCPSCSIPMTLHRRGEGTGLLCHYCGGRRKPPEICPECSASELIGLGTGTQRVEESISKRWPEARIARLDRDAVGSEGAVELLRDFSSGRYDILVGTQMVVKGHHFPSLTVVGVLSGDDLLHFADFRAGERTFQMITQVAGRAGREDKPGVVFVQTRNPHHPVLQAVLSGNFDSWAQGELEERKLAGFPPYRRLALVRIMGSGEVAVKGYALEVADHLRSRGRVFGVELLGPAPAPIERVRGRWRHHILLRATGQSAAPLVKLLDEFTRGDLFRAPGDISVHIDVDPLRML
ncbi:MAG: primosomal protein N' [Deltaproteobacteria bacterium]|nr:MAG: primosomal protein N' [Deltaproteobacteria bacterium]